jgi:hypothetical protein
MMKYAPFLSGVHCIAHRISLVVQALNFLNLVNKIERLFTYMHNYFTHNPKRHLETSKLVELLECKGDKILENIKTHWILMLSPLKKVLA